MTEISSCEQMRSHRVIKRAQPMQGTARKRRSHRMQQPIAHVLNICGMQ
jgi:hypothetical protein